MMEKNHAGGKHPWETMDDEELLKSAGLYGRDIATGTEGYNLAAIMLLGKPSAVLLNSNAPRLSSLPLTSIALI